MNQTHPTSTPTVPAAPTGPAAPTAHDGTGVLAPAEALTALRTLSPGFGLDIGGVWYESSTLIDDPETVASLVSGHAAYRSIEAPRVAASLFFQRYCHRMSTAVIGSWVLTGRALDASAAQVRLCVRDASPVSVHLSGTYRDEDSPEELVRGLVDEHLLPLAQRFGAHGVGLPNLWGNMAASMGMAARQLSRIRDANLVRAAVEPVLATRPQLNRLGSFRILEGPQGPRLFYDRRTCCHWHLVPDGAYCGYCSLLSDDERTARYVASMQAE
ncbi:MAG: IucA/IucC family C-terminal-domain containing protein [Propioniciclava sp.]|uniref:IucA/IucC family C-terminal-domain containing protein n=1 Tax=Propioniciclava sp. TaxID=2038686 RepID=UPI0039E62454